MRQVNIQELEELIKEYVSSEVTRPLFVFGESHRDGRWRTVQKLLGDRCWKITYDYDNPSREIPYCLYNTYLGANYNSTLMNCIRIASTIHRPVFCFIDNSVKNVVPQTILAEYDIYELKET